MKRLSLLSILLCTCLIQAFAYEWTDGNGVTWTFSQQDCWWDENGVNTNHKLWTITGVANYGDEVVVPETVYDGVTPYTVEAIGNSLFRYNLTLNSVALPTTIKLIRNYAFQGCTTLTTITGTANCERIEYYAFDGCSSLGSIDLTNCFYIGVEAFENCNSLTTIGSLANCSVINNGAFEYCSSLQEVNLSDHVQIAEGAFHHCTALSSVGSLNGAAIGNSAFRYCQNLTSVDISQAASLGGSAFEYCSNLTSVGDLSAYTAIPQYAFQGCNKLESVNLSNCKTIDRYAFSSCQKLENIDLSSIVSIGEYAFSGCTSLNALNITSTELATIGSNAFNMPGTITLMGTTPATLAANDAFGSLMVVRVPDAAVADYRAADKWSDFKARIVGISAQLDYNVNVTAMTNKSALIEAVGEEHTGQVVSLKITGDINGYDIMAMRNKMDNLHYIDLSDANIVANDYEYYTGYHTEDNILGGRSFCYLAKLISVKLPKTITKIGDFAFYGCSNLKEIEFQTGLESIGYRAFMDCGSIRELNFKSGLKTIGNEAFGYRYSSSSGTVQIEELVLPEGVESIGSDAFAHVRALKRVAFPSSLKTIGSYAFYDCNQLGNISLPTSLQSIPEYAFQGCSSLTEVRIPSTITSIGDYAFSGCSLLNDVYTYIVEPTQINMNTFSTYTTATLHVPTTSYYNYYYDTEWSQFRELQTFDAEYEYFYLNNDFIITDDQGTIQGEGGNDPDVDLYPGSGLIVETTDDQELDEVHIKVDGDKAGSIIADDNIKANKVYFDITIKGGRWYFLSFPFRVNITNITAPGAYVFRYYSGANRANGLTGWLNWLESWLLPGQGYIFQCAKSGVLSLCVEKADMNWKAENRPQNLEQHQADLAENASWNFMGNPHTSYYDIDKTGYTQPITVWNGSSYEAVRPGDDDYRLSPFEGFFVQKPDGVNEMNFPAGNPATDGRSTYNQWKYGAHSRAEARHAKGVDVDRQLINLTLTDGTSTDKTRVVFNEKQSLSYEIACDAAKFMSTESVPQLYTLDQTDTRYAINERPSGEVRLGYAATKKGELTISAVRMDQPVMLRDNLMQTTHDLSLGGYTFTTEAGTINDRFTLVMNNEFTSIGKMYKDTGVSAMADKGGINFSGIDQQEVTIYSVSGITLGSHVQNGFIQLPSAAYIVKVNNETTKMIVR